LPLNRYPDTVKMDCAVSTGQKQMKKYEFTGLEGFHNSLEKKVVHNDDSKSRNISDLASLLA